MEHCVLSAGSLRKSSDTITRAISGPFRLYSEMFAEGGDAMNNLPKKIFFTLPTPPEVLNLIYTGT